MLLDKTGTITLGNRVATEFFPEEGVSEEELAKAALLSSLVDETPEGRSVIILAKEKLKLKSIDIKTPDGARFIKFSAETRMSGVDIEGKKYAKVLLNQLQFS